jgi:hypothetical protein
VRILIFHARLAHLTGGQVNTRDWALGLKSRGHKIVVYTLEPGPMAEEVRAAGIPVVTDPALVADTPDVMVGSGVHDIAALLARFPDVPAIQVGQVWEHWNGYPCLLPQAVLHVAVDDLNAEMFANEFGIPRDRIRIIHNAVDLTRVASRKHPLPARPARALVFVKRGNPSFEEALRTTCSARNIGLEFFGYPIHRPLYEPLSAIADYDLVIGAARTAIEGAVVGAAVLVADHRGLAGMLTAQNVARFRKDNFGRELLTRPLDAETIGQEIDRYDASDAAEVSRILREDASLDHALDRWEAVFAEAIALFRQAPPTPDDVRKALASYLSLHLPRPWEPSPRHDRLKGGLLFEERLHALSHEVEQRLAAVSTRVNEQLASLTRQADEQPASLRGQVDERLAAVMRQVDERLSIADSRSSAASEQTNAVIPKLAALERDVAAIHEFAARIQSEIAALRQSAGEACSVEEFQAFATRVEGDMMAFRRSASEVRDIEGFFQRNAALLRFLRPAALAVRRLPWFK